MPELRKEPISERWVIVATERGKRPHDFPSVSVGTEPPPKNCPLCEGNEHMTPPEMTAWRKPNTMPNGPGWDIRVVENKFPALVKEGDVERKGIGILDYMRGVGAHELLIETPKHDIGIADMPIEQVDRILWAYKQRIIELEKDPRFRYVLIFRNYGSDAGASLGHPHSQLIATPVTPRYVKLELTNSKQYFQQKERCIFCDLLRQEINSGERIVAESEFFIALAPFASRFPFETWILPRRHHAVFQEIGDEERLQLAMMLKDVMTKLKTILKDPPYNYVLHTAPNPTPRPGRPDYWGTIRYDYHWHIEIIPRLTKVAGFEWGSGLYINPTPPEKAAKFLKEMAE